MFDTDDYLTSWAEEHGLGEDAFRLIKLIRESEPDRRVSSGTRNVSGRYPSRKMRRTIQFAAHRNQLAAILEMEHDPDVVEYWDLPPSIKLDYNAKNGKERAVIVSPDFFVIRCAWAGWVQCEIEEALQETSSRRPGLYRRDVSNRWHSPAGDAYAARLGLRYIIKSSADIDWVFQRNVLFLEDYLRGELSEIPIDVISYTQALASAKPGISVADMLSILTRHEISADHIYTLLVTDRLYADLSAAPLAEPDRVLLYLDRAAANMNVSTAPPHTLSKFTRVEFQPGETVRWDNRTWEVLNHGETHTWLRSQGSKPIFIDNESLFNLVANNYVERPTGGLPATSLGTDYLTSLLSGASVEDLVEANRRYRLLMNYRKRWKSEALTVVSERTLWRWQALFNSAEASFGCGFAGLLPRTQQRGNSRRKLPNETLHIMQELIDKEYAAAEQPRKHSVWLKTRDECLARGTVPPSYQTFCREVEKMSSQRRAERRRGRRAASKSAPFYMELEMKTPRHGERPFEITHIDHTELDVELICSQTGENLGRPWLTLLTDAYSRRILAYCLTYDPPSYRSCMLVVRECVRRHHRLPQTFVTDGGREFGSIYFETLLASYGCTLKTRPAAKPRFGSVCERLFGTINTRFIYNLRGNTQLTKTNVRLMTKEVNPKNLAVWTLSALDEKMREFAYEVHDTLIHPALACSPRAAFEEGRALAGHREQRLIAYDEKFEMLTLPSTRKGTARVVPGRGVQINYIYYWTEGFYTPGVAGSRVAVRYDPFDAARAYAFVNGQWRLCHTAYPAAFHGRTERELKIAAAELLRRNRLGGKHGAVNARLLADFLTGVKAKEQDLLRLQRARDSEARRAREGNRQVAPAKQSGAGERSGETGLRPPRPAHRRNPEYVAPPLLSGRDEEIALSDLERYGEY